MALSLLLSLFASTAIPVPQPAELTVGGQNVAFAAPADGDLGPVVQEQAAAGDLPHVGEVDHEAALAAGEDGPGRRCSSW